MADIALRMNEFGGDIVVAGFDLLPDDGLETAVILSLFTDRRAESAEQIPPELPKDDLRGYWGDVAPAVEGDKHGSLLWLLAREKQMPAVLGRAEQYATDALRWMVDDKVATRVEVSASFVATGWMLLEVGIYRPDGDPVSYRYSYEWASQAAKRAA